ncbi:hypothetical protein RJ641_014460 [Dillenia turbinata]|uniref:Uncharacterized protein n=1 Tax=Dillenia turbinata TaxID=194707 RepID=A0AAN8V1B0_9MAGN
MDDSDKLDALKKAFADMILNQSKEAAARIMAAERKATRFQRQLEFTKEESLNMLMRLKRMLDSQVNEAEVKSSSQQKKIEELEAQLQEAEDIVKDLREELSIVQAELRKLKTNQSHPLDGKYSEMDVPSQENMSLMRLNAFESVTFPLAQHPVSDVEMTSYNGNGPIKLHIPQNSNRENFLGDNPVIPSIILRNKGRNGCTQRICASERNTLNGNLPHSKQIEVLKNDTMSKEDSESEVIHKNPNAEAGNDLTVEKNPTDPKLTQVFGASYQVSRVKPVIGKGKRSTRYTKFKPPSSRPDIFMEAHQLIDLSSSKSQSGSLNNEEITVTANQEGTESPCSTGVSPHETDVCMGSGDADATVKDTNLANGGSFQQSLGNDINLVKSALTAEDSQSTESLARPVCKGDLGRIDMPAANSDVKESQTADVAQIRILNESLLKYTFQRKRKRGTLSSNSGNGFLEKCTQQKKVEEAGERQSNSGESHKSSSTPESSRDGRQLAQVEAGEKQSNSGESHRSSLTPESSKDRRLVAQVAHELISLSAKNGWN